VTKVYQLTTTDAGGAVQGVQPSGEYLAGADITDQLINLTNQVQAVTYHFKARIRDDRAGHIGSFCDQGGDTSITVYVNPTPVLSVSIPDTIYCDSNTININVNDLNGSTQGEKVYELTTTNAGGTVFGVQASGEYIAGTDISDKLINLSSKVQVVTYHFKARIRDDRSGTNFGYCDQGGDTIITVYVNPTPSLSVSIPDTIYCDSSTISITVNDLNGNTQGVKVYQLTTTDAGGNVLGVEASGEIAAGTDISNQLINLSNQIQAVTYHFKARIRDDRMSNNFGYCDQGGDTIITIYVNPTPVLSVSIPDTIYCDSSTINITVNDLNGSTQGAKVYELTTTNAGGTVLGVQASGEYIAGTDISDELINLSSEVQAVTYHFKARIRDDRSGTNFGYCDQGGDTIITVYVNPTPSLSVSIPDTIYCDSSTITITVNDLNGNTQGFKVYELTTTDAGGNVLGVEPSAEIAAGTDISNQLINLTSQVQAVTYHFKARIRDDRTGNNFGYCDQGGDTLLTIYVNPTPVLSVSVPDTIVCDSSTITITVNDLNGSTQGAKVYELTTTDAGGTVLGVQPTGEYTAGTDISDKLINTSSQVQAVTYHFKARIRDDRSGTNFGYCDQGGDTSLTVYVNPTPKLSVSVPDTIWCDSSTISITVNDLNGSTQGVKVYELTTTDAGGNVLGVQPSGEYTASTDISDQLINLTSEVQTVTYHFKARIRDDRTGNNFGYCDQGGDTLLTLYINPTPRLSVSIPDTIVCDSSTISITVNDLNGSTQGAKVYELTTTDAGGTVLGVQPTGEYTAGTDISDKLINTSSQVQAVTYHFKARIRDDRSGTNFGYCDQGGDTSLTVYVNPTPKLSVSVPDTIWCDSSTISITVNDLNGSTQGVKVYELTTTDAGGNVLGVQPSGEYTASTDISNQLINLTSEVQEVTYHFKARIRDDRTGHTGEYCDQGGDTLITLYINPTPRLSISIPDTIYCDSSTISITVNDLNGITQGVKVYQLTTTNAGGTVLGVQPTGEYNAGTDISDKLINLTSQVQEVTYQFKARIWDNRTGHASDYCDQGGDTLITIYVNPTPQLSVSVPDTIFCDSSLINISVNDLNGITQGVKVYQLTTTNAGGTVLGVQPTGEYNAGTDISNQLINLTSQVQTVTYHFKARIHDNRTGHESGYCSQGGDTLLTLYINPTPKLNVSIADTIYCDSTTISIRVDNLTGTTRGIKVYQLTSTNAGGNVLGVEPSGEFAAGADFSDKLINLTSQVQAVTYHFKARIRDDRTGHTSDYCDQGGDTLLTVYVNPTPRLSVSIPDTVYCDSSTINITINDLLGNTSGTKVYQVTTTDASGKVTGLQVNGEYPAGTDISNYLVNTTTSVQKVTYHFKARIKDERTGNSFDYCNQGGDTLLTIWINPTPRIRVSVPDTLYCNESDVRFKINNLNPSIIGQRAYNLTVTYDNSYISGVQPDGIYTMDMGAAFTNTLVNSHDSIYRKVTYHFMPQILDASTGFDCNVGIDTSISVYVAATLNSRILSRKYIGGHDIRCFGENNGALDLEVWGGFGETDLGLPGYTYSWKASPDGDGIVQGQQDQDNLTKGQYNVVITDAKSCLRYDTITLVEPEVLEIGWDTVTRNPCKSIGRAYIELQPAGGNEPYSYQWSGPNNFRLTTQNVYDLFQGFYTVVITDANGCRYFDKNGYIVVDADPIGLSIDNKMYGYYNVRCYGNTDGRLSIEGAQGGNGDYRDWKYHWTGPDYYEADTRTIENLAPGQYYLEIEDTSGCIHKIDEAQQRELEAVYIKEPPPISLDTVITSLYGGMYNISCNDSSDGFAEIAVDKDRLLRTYKYTWSTSTYTFPDTTSTRYNLPAGTYYVNILDNWGCPFSDTIILTEPPEINITPSFSDYNGYEVACFDGLNGRIAVQPTGGLQPYDYAWESVTTGTGYPSLNDSLITGLQAGTYRVTVTDSLNCAREWDFTLDQPEIIQVHPYPLFLNDDTLINVSCYGLSDASIDSIGTTGGIPDYSYFWTSESDTSWESPVENPTGMPAGIYVVTVTDQNGCTMETATTIKQPDPLSIDSVSIWNISCNASDDGSARIIEVSGGTPDYSFLWNDPAATTGPLVRNLPKGPVMVTVTDLNGCDTTQTVVIGEPDVLIVQLAPRVQYNGEVISCPDASDGSINARFSGGRPPYSYTWSPSGETGTTTSTMITLDGLPEDTYYIQVTDTAGCADDASLQIVDPVRMEIYPTLINITCHSYCDGSIEVAVAGGIRPLSYEWSNERTELGISGLCPGDYTVDITDQNSCHQDTTFTITEPEPLTITVDSVSPTCPDSYDGQISINVTGGTPKYEYSWSNGESNTTIIQNLGPDEYSVTVFDVNRCEIEREIVLLEDASSCIVIPTAITPNHDGYNDYWDIPGMHYYPRAVIEIFNRWGDLVYRSEGNYDIKFDGTYRGRELPMDSYHFVIDLKNGSDAIRGTITIIK
jgi:gliding motility-associated-like protein